MVHEFPHRESVASNTSRTAEAAREAARIDIEKRNENVYVASTRASIASGGTLNVHLRNPTDSGLDCNVAQIEFSTRFQGVYTIYDTFSSAPSGGTALEIDNLLMDTEDLNGDGNMTVNEDVTFTATGSPHLVGVIPSGGQGANQIGGESIGTRPLIEPNREIVAEVQNDSTESETGAITVVYTEDSQ